jgi:hypothetical protein
VCLTCRWDHRSGIYRAATGPPTTCLNTQILFPSVWSKIKSRPVLLNRAKPLACPWGVWGYVMRDLKASAGPGPDRCAAYRAATGPDNFRQVRRQFTTISDKSDRRSRNFLPKDSQQIPFTMPVIEAPFGSNRRLMLNIRRLLYILNSIELLACLIIPFSVECQCREMAKSSMRHSEPIVD